MQRTLKRWFIDTSSNKYFLVSDILAFVTVLSIFSVVLETVPAFEVYRNYFLVVEWFAVVVFTGEYVARLMVIKPTRSYLFSFYGFIDFISIAPTYLGLGNFTFLKSARALRLIRLLRMVRLAKMKHFKTHDIEEKMGYFTINILLFVTVMVTAVLFVGTLIYLVEGNHEAFVSIPHGMLWSFKVFLIGIPIAYPETVGGEVVHMVARLVGLTVFGVLVGVIGNSIRDLIFTPATSKLAKRRRK